MSDAKEEKPKEAPEPKKGGPSIVALLVPAVLAAGGGFGGAKFGAVAAANAGPRIEIVAEKPPGPTIALDPFILTVQDAAQHAHAMKLTIAIELGHGEKDEEFKAFLPRIRDAALSYLRSLKFEDAQGDKLEHVRNELKERFVHLGAKGTEQVLITDFVAQ